MSAVMSAVHQHAVYRPGAVTTTSNSSYKGGGGGAASVHHTPRSPSKYGERYKSTYDQGRVFQCGGLCDPYYSGRKLCREASTDSKKRQLLSGRKMSADVLRDYLLNNITAEPAKVAHRRVSTTILSSKAPPNSLVTTKARPSRTSTAVKPSAYKKSHKQPQHKPSPIAQYHPTTTAKQQMPSYNIQQRDGASPHHTAGTLTKSPHKQSHTGYWRSGSSGQPHPTIDRGRSNSLQPVPNKELPVPANRGALSQRTVPVSGKYFPDQSRIPHAGIPYGATVPNRTNYDSLKTPVKECVRTRGHIKPGADRPRTTVQPRHSTGVQRAAMPLNRLEVVGSSPAVPYTAPVRKQQRPVQGASSRSPTSRIAGAVDGHQLHNFNSSYGKFLYIDGFSNTNGKLIGYRHRTSDVPRTVHTHAPVPRTVHTHAPVPRTVHTHAPVQHAVHTPAPVQHTLYTPAPVQHTVHTHAPTVHTHAPVVATAAGQPPSFSRPQYTTQPLQARTHIPTTASDDMHTGTVKLSVPRSTGDGFADGGRSDGRMSTAGGSPREVQPHSVNFLAARSLGGEVPPQSHRSLISATQMVPQQQAPSTAYTAPNTAYTAPTTAYTAHSTAYTTPTTAYTTPTTAYTAPTTAYTAHSTAYTAPTTAYTA
eukprot:Lankesteria_metandrocarpae@DN4414_c0_g1_i3.p1